MGRALLVLLLMANGVYLAWHQGWLHAVGFAPASEREPQRLQQQVRPDALKLLSTQEFKRVENLLRADSAPRECLRLGPFDSAQAEALQAALQGAFPAGTVWQQETESTAARWILYMGRFANPEAQAKKREELAGMRLSTVALVNPELEPGLSLGAFETQAAANAELARLATRGVRTARVVLERPAAQQTQFRFPAFSPDMKARLQELKAQFAGRQLRGCA